MNGALLSSAAQLAGTFYSGSVSRNESRRNRRWQKKMAKNAMQYRVQDLKAAGLNPILAAGTSGAHVGPGAMAQVPDYGEAFGKSVSTALAVRREKAMIKSQRARADIDNVDASFQRDVYNAYRKNPMLRKTITAAMLAKAAGLNPELGFGGAALGTTASALQKGVKAIGPKLGPTISNWLNESVRKGNRKRKDVEIERIVDKAVQLMNKKGK